MKWRIGFRAFYETPLQCLLLRNCVVHLVFINKLLRINVEVKRISINNRKLLMQNDVVQEFDNQQRTSLANIHTITRLIPSLAVSY